MSALEDWADAVCRELSLTGIDSKTTVPLVLDLARDVAHSVARPAAPLTAYLLGVAVGRSAGPESAAELVSRVAALAAGWSRSAAAGPESPGSSDSPGGPGTATDSTRNATLRDAPNVERHDQEPP